jgi:hypothetical protein
VTRWQIDLIKAIPLWHVSAAGSALLYSAAVTVLAGTAVPAP